MKRYIQTAILLLLVGSASCKHKSSDKEGGETPRIEVAEAITDSVVLHKTYPGILSASNSADVVCKVNGQIQSSSYTPGTYVKKGQVLFTIDATLYRDRVNQAEATLNSAISNRDYAKSHYEAVKKALVSNAVSKMEVLNAESAYEQAEASIREAQAELHTARTNLGYCTVTAPISGYITESTLDPGNYVSGGDSPVKLASIYDNSSFDAIFQIEDAQYEKMVGGIDGTTASLYKKMPIKFRENLHHQYTADLTYKAPTVSQSTGTIELRGHVVNYENELKDGMYCTVSLPYGEDPKGILIKDAAISTDQLGKYIYVVNDSNKVVYTPIKVGDVYRDSLRLVTEGIKPGEKYVTKALLTVRNGETVDPVVTK